MRPLLTFINEIRANVGCEGAPDSMIESYVRHTLRDMANRTNLFTRQERFHFQCGQLKYHLNAPENWYILRFSRVYFNDLTNTEIMINPMYYVIGRERNTIEFKRFPSMIIPRCAVWLDYVLAPTEKVCHLPDSFPDTHYMTVVAGASYYLLNQAGMKWYNPRAAQSQQQIYENAIDNIKLDVAYGGQTTSDPFRKRGHWRWHGLLR